MNSEFYSQLIRKHCVQCRSNIVNRSVALTCKALCGSSLCSDACKLAFDRSAEKHAPFCEMAFKFLRADEGGANKKQDATMMLLDVMGGQEKVFLTEFIVIAQACFYMARKTSKEERLVAKLHLALCNCISPLQNIDCMKQILDFVKPTVSRCLKTPAELPLPLYYRLRYDVAAAESNWQLALSNLEMQRIFCVNDCDNPQTCGEQFLRNKVDILFRLGRWQDSFEMCDQLLRHISNSDLLLHDVSVMSHALRMKSVLYACLNQPDSACETCKFALTILGVSGKQLTESEYEDIGATMLLLVDRCFSRVKFETSEELLGLVEIIHNRYYDNSPIECAEYLLGIASRLFIFLRDSPLDDVNFASRYERIESRLNMSLQMIDEAVSKMHRRMPVWQKDALSLRAEMAAFKLLREHSEKHGSVAKQKQEKIANKNKKK